MPGTNDIPTLTLLVPLAFAVAYYDVRYRRIPNALVLATLAGGLLINFAAAGAWGLAMSVGGCVVGFALMLALHVFGAMGAGDVKLFAAVGSVLGAHVMPQTFVVVMLTGGALAVVTIFRTGTAAETMRRVFQIFAGLLPGWTVPRFDVPRDRRLTIPYGVAITLGSIISLAIFRA